MKFEYIPLAVLGCSHKTAPVDIRERVSLSRDEQRQLLKRFADHEPTQGVIALSTCNRTEVYFSSENIEESISLLRSWFLERKSVDFVKNEYVYTHQGYSALLHFFSVISGLDSQIIGETQITGQVKEAHNLALELKATDSLLNKVYHLGILAQKKVKNDTYLCHGAASVSLAGVELARKIFANLEDKTVLLIGAGETARLCAEHFRSKGVANFHIANRTPEKAENLATIFNGQAYNISEIEAVLENVDIVISATSSQNYVLTTELMEKSVQHRNKQPFFLIDLAIPRDIDPSIDNMENVYLYNLDDLNEVVKINTEKRASEIPKAQKILNGMIRDFDDWYAVYSVSSTVNKLKQYFEHIFHNEIARIAKNVPDDVQSDLDELQKNLTNKLVRQHVKLLKKNSSGTGQKTHIEMIHDLFELE